MQSEWLKQDIFRISDDESFLSAATQIYRHQMTHVNAYRKFIELLQLGESAIKHYSEFPFLPITAFRNHMITDQKITPEKYFISSGTTSMSRSRHYIHDTGIYEHSIVSGFEQVFGNPEQYAFLALLPSYLEQGDSSLVYMMNTLMQAGGHPMNGFYLNNHAELRNNIEQLKKQETKIFLVGVTFALLDFFENNRYDDSQLIIVETGGMKGRRKEMIREEVHEILIRASGTEKIHSEYGMTELLSQAWSTGNGVFQTPPWMKVMITDMHNPGRMTENGQTGIINVIDLANVHSCSFITTQDIGRKLSENTFEVLGRMDSSEWRGCNLMVM